MTNKKITSKTKISEILRINPEAIEILFNEGMGCIGCPMAQMETLEDGCKAHGMSDVKVKELLKKLNKDDKERFRDDYGYYFGDGEKNGPIKKLRDYIKGNKK
jgi:hybrid cluster-associated redox disulfide protein